MRRDADTTIDALRRVLPRTAVLTDAGTRAALATDHSLLPGDCAAVVRPSSEAEVLAVLGVAREQGFSIVPRGAGTAATGAAVSEPGQVVLDLSAMNRILEVDERDLVAVVEPGVLTGALQSAAEAKGLFYPPDPASSALSTIGGNVATCAGGLRAVKYGVTRDYVLGIRAALADGSVVDLGGRNLKSVVGYDLVRLLVGSEGTLAVFLRIVLRLIPRPPCFETILASFKAPEGGLAAADALLAAGILPRALEYLDRDVLEVVAPALGEALPPGVQSRLLVELDGADAQVREDVARALAALRAAGASDARVARTAAERDDLWKARRSVSKAVLALAPAKKSEDLGVPRSQLAGAIADIKAAGRAEGIRVLAYGHAGDANLHVNFLYDPASATQMAALPRAIAAARAVVLARGGTISGEHGIGLTKREAARDEISPRALDLMRGIKRVFDPAGRLNPGKALPEDGKD
jgi:glycolate oxidase subunit GlcD